MSFYYDLHPIKDNINETPKTGLRAKAVSRGTLGIEYIAERMAEKQTFSKGEIMGMIFALADEVEYVLSLGFNADLGDLGTFSISATSKTVEKKTEIRAESIELKRIVHRPSRKMTKRLKTVDFQRISPELRGKKNKVRT